jgi:hypothetical protein
LAVYAAAAEPDAARFAREQGASERSMERAFGNALDARLAPGYRGASGYVPLSQRSCGRRREPYLYPPK